ncbi:MAG: gliding motility-associated C-terminal domain-containing protein [Sphingobacteriales bacterium]|nr:gliding motility-associated C-terminal domain-containing protein [Sphingobacteriales bacterium]
MNKIAGFLFLWAGSGLFFSSSAQLCSGSLGDPVVNITFGNSTDVSGFTAPGYSFTNNLCPNDGYYTIVTSSSGCFGNTWHSVPEDHTGAGAFMLVNASNAPGDFFVSTVAGLCPNTTYEFSCWVLNILSRAGGGIMPNITFRIETLSGAILGSYNSGDIPQTPVPLWKQYGLYFTTTTGTTNVVIRLTNNAPGGIGNDLALDDITFRPCGPTLNSFITTGNNNNIDVCISEQIVYNFDAALSPGFLLPAFQWQLSSDSGITWKDIAGANSKQYIRQPTTAGQYFYRLTVAESGNAGIADCRIASNVLSINVHPSPVVNAGPDRIVINGGQTTLVGSATGENIIYYWSPSDYLSSDTVFNPVSAPDRDMYYTLKATSSYGCQNEDYVNVKVVAGIFVPTAFTPNNDGKNDSWRIPYLDPFFNAVVIVYNRYGQKIYNASGAAVNWDGTLNGDPQPSGIYVYLIRFQNGLPDMKGTILLTR